MAATVDDKLMVKLRNATIPRFHNYLFKKNEHNIVENELLSNYRMVMKFCKNNPNVIFTQARKIYGSFEEG